jgi:hypothetical protein
MSVGALVISLIGTAVSAYGSYQQGKAQQRAADYNAKVQEAQAIQQDMENRENIRRERRAGKDLMSSQRQKLGASGVVIGSGAPPELLGKTAGELELRAQDAARAGRSQFQYGMSEAAMTRWSGKQAASAGLIGAAGTLLQGTGSAIANYKMATK